MIQAHIHHLSKHRHFIEIKKIISEFLTKQGYTEVDVPVLSPVLIPESYLEIFKTNFIYEKNKQEYYLTPSPEIFLKRLITEGSGNIFTITKSFRNGEPATSRHFPEFTMLELYKVNADYFDLAEDVLKMFQAISLKLYGKTTITYQNRAIDLNRWEYITVSEAFKNYAKINNIFDHKSFFNQAGEKGYVTKGFSYTDVWSQIYTQEIEPHLGINGKPTLIYEYPIELAALAEIDKDKKVAKRFECYIEGVELGNCCNETSGKSITTERKRFKYDLQERERKGLLSHEPDNDFLDTVARLPKCAGIAIGLNRLAMIFTNSKKIDELQIISL
jgi:elongation factor P--beta-lysine ligase